MTPTKKRARLTYRSTWCTAAWSNSSGRRPWTRLFGRALAVYALRFRAQGVRCARAAGAPTQCKGRKARESGMAKTTSTESSTDAASSSSSHSSGGFYCNSCKRELRLTKIDILRHKKQCRNSK
ncbi:GD24460 [Drosophila simulans]|uniref:GD24460 n=1 Tax=Drosophila simulans TaxID=7240 RepID=B4NUQ7_DROSI|nr:GD24460 [Drosophila simulans]